MIEFPMRPPLAGLMMDHSERQVKHLKRLKPSRNFCCFKENSTLVSHKKKVAVTLRDGQVGIGENMEKPEKSRSKACWCAQHHWINQTQSHQKQRKREGKCFDHRHETSLRDPISGDG